MGFSYPYDAPSHKVMQPHNVPTQCYGSVGEYQYQTDE